MGGTAYNTVGGSLDTLFRVGVLGSLTDAALLEQFLAGGKAAEAAFEVLVRRHGPMVLGVCRRFGRDEHEAADAFQATFLVLVRRAGAVRRRDSLALAVRGRPARCPEAEGGIHDAPGPGGAGGGRAVGGRCGHGGR